MSPEDFERARVMRDQGKTMSEIGRELNVSRRTIGRNFGGKYKLQVKNEEVLERKRRARQMKHAGASMATIARELGISKTYASNISCDIKPGPQAVRNPPPWLEEAKADYRGGLTRQQVADKYGCTLYQARRYLKSVKWANEAKVIRDDRDKRIANQRLMGRTHEELTKLFGLSLTRVRLILVQQGIESSNRSGRKKRLPPKNSREQINQRVERRNQEVLNLRKKGYSAFEVAYRTSVLLRVVRDICQRAGHPYRSGSEYELRARVPKPDIYHTAHIGAYQRKIDETPVKRERNRKLEYARRRARQQVANEAFKRNYDPNAGLTEREIRFKQRREKLHELMVRDRINRPSAAITLPKISLQSLDF